MNYSLHIPRPSLTGSTTSTRSGGSSTRSYSESINSYAPIHASSSRNLLLQQENENFSQPIKTNLPSPTNFEYKNERRNTISSAILDYDLNNKKSDSNKSRRQQRIQQYKQKRSNNDKFNKSMDDRFDYNINDNKNKDFINQLKRGSRSSQGSSDSNNSVETTGSGSLLLTTANLERFVAIHNKNPTSNSNYIRGVITNDRATTTTTNTNLNRTDKQQNEIKNKNLMNVYTIANNHMNKMNKKIDNGDDMIIEDVNDILEIDPNLHFVKTKDVDTVSIASSTHFTMVNGVGGPQRKTKKSGICSRGHQLTVLILTMSGLFLIGILFMVYLMEMRAREMPMM